MKRSSETFLKFEGFAAWNWEDELRGALALHKPNADEAAVNRMRLEIVAEFVEFVREVVNEEFELGLLIDVEGLAAQGVVGRVDFADDRRTALARIERRIEAWRRIPKGCRTGPIMDRLIACTEIIRAPDRLDPELGSFKRECLTHFKNEGSIALVVESLRADGSRESLFGPAPVRTAASAATNLDSSDMPRLDDLTFD